MRNPTPSANLAAEIRAHLARRGLSRQWLATEIGMAGSGLSRRLNGHRSFTFDEVARIADALALPISALLSEPEKAAS